MSMDRARRIKEFLQSQVGVEIIAMLDEQAKEPLDELYEIMIHRPGTAMGEIAHTKAGAANGLRKFKESLLDAARTAK